MAESAVWDRLVGQDRVRATLERAAQSAAAIVSGSGDVRAMTHAWLITGPPGSGRSVAAWAFATALQCHTGVGCGHCNGCTTALAKTHPDITAVRTDRVVITIDEVAGLVARAQQSPVQGRWRVIIIEDADRMLERTTNLLLKAIEEPPAQTVWLLCAPSPHDMLTTIRSRCRQLRLRIPPLKDVADLLVRTEGVDPDRALEAACAAQSHIATARSLVGDEATRHRRAEVLSLPGRISSVGSAVVAAQQLLDLTKQAAEDANNNDLEREQERLVQSLGYATFDEVPRKLRGQFTALEKDHKRRATRAQRDIIDRALIDLIGLYRDVFIHQLGIDAIPINADMVGLIENISRSSTAQLTLARIDAINTARTRLQANGQPLLVLEAMATTFAPNYRPSEAETPTR